MESGSRERTGNESRGRGVTPGRLESDDRALLQSVADKDRLAFEALYYRYHRRLYQFLFRISRSPETTDELLNDVMYVVWNQAAAFKGQSKVSTWIFGIAYRKALKEYDRSKRRPESFQNDQLTELKDPALTSHPEEWMANLEFSRQLKQGIASLGPEHRSVVELTALGYSYREIGNIVNCPEGTVKTRMFHARRQIKRFIS